MKYTIYVIDLGSQNNCTKMVAIVNKPHVGPCTTPLERLNNVWVDLQRQCNICLQYYCLSMKVAGMVSSYSRW